MSSEVKTKNQHWVPQFYMRHFATKDSFESKKPQVWVWDKTKQSSINVPVSVRNICGQRYLYSPKNESGSRSSNLENKLGELEGVASKIWPKLIAGKIDLTNQKIRVFLAEFFSVLHLRNVFIYRAIDKIMDLRDKLYGSPSHEFLKSRLVTDPDPTHSGRYFIHTMLENIDKYMELILQKRWIIYESKEAGHFTSDRPVLFTLKSPFSERSEMLIPLSPKHVLTTNGVGNQPSKYLALSPAGLVLNTNKLVEEKSIRFLISARPRCEYLPKQTE